MIHFFTDNTRIAKNEYNIPEPVDGIEVPSQKNRGRFRSSSSL
jgi:5-formyltetrahydrofolate cyclo-ligase